MISYYDEKYILFLTGVRNTGNIKIYYPPPHNPEINYEVIKCLKSKTKKY